MVSRDSSEDFREFNELILEYSSPPLSREVGVEATVLNAVDCRIDVDGVVGDIFHNLPVSRGKDRLSDKGLCSPGETGFVLLGTFGWSLDLLSASAKSRAKSRATLATFCTGFTAFSVGSSPRRSNRGLFLFIPPHSLSPSVGDLCLIPSRANRDECLGPSTRVVANSGLIAEVASLGRFVIPVSVASSSLAFFLRSSQSTLVVVDDVEPRIDGCIHVLGDLERVEQCSGIDSDNLSSRGCKHSAVRVSVNNGLEGLGTKFQCQPRTGTGRWKGWNSKVLSPGDLLSFLVIWHMSLLYSC